MCALKEKEKSEQNLEVQNRTVFLYQYLPIALLLHRLTIYERVYVICLFNYYIFKVIKYTQADQFFFNHMRNKQKLQL